MAASDHTTPATASTPGAPPPPPARPPRRSFKSWLYGSLIGALVLIGLYTAFMLWFDYAEGERAGVLQKFSKRGWVCKTWEGELAMYVVGGVAPQIWDFSVRDDAVAQDLLKAVGQQVRLSYSQHPGVPTNCFGETEFYIERVEVVPPPSVMQPSSGMSVIPAAPPATATPRP
jgi:hypothetical protein